MKKLLSVLTAVMILLSAVFGANTVNAKNDKVQMLPVMSAESKQPDRVWVGTFQLVWNEFADNIVKGPVLFKDGTPEVAKQLNRQSFKKSMLSEDSYYTAYGKTTLELKKQIEDAIMAKFNETSDILDKIDWEDPNNAYLIYSMLKKDFNYTTRFDILAKEKFNNSKTKYEYFGIDEKNNDRDNDGVKVLFYNNPFDYAVALQAEKDEVILYRTNSNNNFKSVYQDINKKAAKYKGSKTFVKGDKLKVPFITLKEETNYKELCGHEILNTDRLYIGQALNTVDFNMNNTGIKLKSEAAMSIMKMSLVIPQKLKGRNFYFNNTFILFLKEKDKSMPYYAMRVQDMELYKYTGEVK